MGRHIKVTRGQHSGKRKKSPISGETARIGEPSNFLKAGRKRSGYGGV